MPAAALLSLVLLLSLGPAAGSDARSDPLICALQKAASYLERARQDFILDGFVGYRFSNARIDEICMKSETKPWRRLQCQTLRDIKRRTSNVADQSMASVMQKDIEYFTELSQIIEDNFWKTPSTWTETNSTLVYSDMNNLDCHRITPIRECTKYILIGSRENNLPACSVTETCRKYMTQPGCSGYILSHQLFYSMIAYAKGCTDPLFGEEISNYNNIFCANMMKVNQMIEELNFPFISQDLFAENILFCAMVGFSDFLKPEWLKVMLSWQDPYIGCFGNFNEETTHTASREVLDLILGDSLLVAGMDLVAEISKQEKAKTKYWRHSHRRVKRNDAVLKDGCLCHMTSVVVGAISQFLVNY